MKLLFPVISFFFLSFSFLIQAVVWLLNEIQPEKKVTKNEIQYPVKVFNNGLKTR